MFTEEEIRLTSDREFEEFSDRELNDYILSGQEVLTGMAKEISAITGVTTEGAPDAVLSTDLSDAYWRQEIRLDFSLKEKLVEARRIQERAGGILAAVSTASINRMERVRKNAEREYRREVGLPPE